MNRTSALSIVAIMLGIVLLYVGWANSAGLIPPYSMCEKVGVPATVHSGENYTLVYWDGCTPYPDAWLWFAAVTVAGLANLGGGLYIARPSDNYREPMYQIGV